MKSPSPFDRRSLLIFLLPQLVLLVGYIASRATVWAAVIRATHNFQSFSFELISADAGWALMSLSVLLCSTALYLATSADHIVAVLRADGFAQTTATELESAVNRLRAQNRYGLWAALVWFFTISVVGAASMEHARAGHGSVLAAAFNWPTFGAVLGAAWALLWLGLLHDSATSRPDDGALNLEHVLLRVFTRGRQWANHEDYVRLLQISESPNVGEGAVLQWLRRDLAEWRRHRPEIGQPSSSNSAA